MTASSHHITVTTHLPEQVIESLSSVGSLWTPRERGRLSHEQLKEAVAGADGIIATLNDEIGADVADAAGSSLRVVANVAVGHNNIDLDALHSRGIIVTNTPGVLTEATADIGFGLLLSVTRRLGEGERLLRSRTPWSFELDFMLGTGLTGKTLGIVGLGQIGQAMARRAIAFGMDVVYTSRRRVSSEVEQELNCHRLPMNELLSESDVVSLHCPLTSETHHLMNAETFAMMKPTAYLINTTRGPVVDEVALATALAEGAIAGAGLDVFEEEPKVEPSLLKMDNVALSPHLGSATVETRTAMAQLAADNAKAVLTGNNPLTPVRN